ncbi:MAG: tetratricopeptide repeat protein, partial [Vallitaleaceae bacterium]|nr:tetratricopeptide repeat protein [Vallitaleaceae bacterium]
MKRILYYGIFAILFLSAGCSLIQKPSVESALNLIDDGKTDRAITMLDKLLEEDEENYEAYLGLYQAYYEEENYRKADKVLSQLSELLIENYDEEDDELQDFADSLQDAKEELEEDYDKIGSWYSDFMASPYRSELVEDNQSDDPEDNIAEEDQEDDGENTSPDTQYSLEELDANMLLSMTRKDVISLLGEPDQIDDFESFTEAYYNDEGYSVVYSVKETGDSAAVKIVGLLEEASVFDLGEKILAEQYTNYHSNYGVNYTTSQYLKRSLFGDGNPIARYTKEGNAYLLMMDANDRITFAYALDNESTVTASQMEAEDYIGLTLGDLKRYHGDIYFTEPSDEDLIVFFFNSPYYFMFEGSSTVTDTSVITSVMLDNGGFTMGFDTLSTATRSDIDRLIGS